MSTDQPDLQLPILIVIRGIPGSGKSYIATHLQQALGKDKTTMLDPDSIDKTSKEYQALVEELTQQGVDEKLYPYRFLRGEAYSGITSHKAIIWNQAFTDFTGLERTIIRLQAFAGEHSLMLPVLIVETKINETIAKKRIAARASKGGHNVPAEAFARFISQYKSFADNGYPVVTVNGDAAINDSIAAILSALKK